MTTAMLCHRRSHAGAGRRARGLLRLAGGLAAIAVLVAGCSGHQAKGEDVTVIAPALPPPNPVAAGSSDASAITTAAMAQGLVRFDASGQVQPGLATRWAIVDQGRSMIFRLDEIGAEGRRPVWLTSALIAQQLRRNLIDNPGNPLAPHFSVVEAVRAVTPKVIEIRLSRARPELLVFLAQPAAGLIMRDRGTGPFALHARAAQGWSLAPIGSDLKPLVDGGGDPLPGLTMRARPAAQAIVLFKRGWTDLVLGGRLGDVPLLDAARIDRSRVVFDPADGLFGLRFRDRSPFLREEAMRKALAMAIDRKALLQAIGAPADLGREEVMPGPTVDLGAVGPSNWTGRDADDRVRFARAQIAEWRRAGRAVPTLRFYVPAGAGYRLLFAALKTQWAGIGVRLDAATSPADADFDIVDAVAPANVASWYLRQLMCQPGLVCDRFADRKLIEARDADDMIARRKALGDAAESLGSAQIFLPLGRPVRWSVVSPDLVEFAPNSRAIHPLSELRRPGAGS